MTDIIIKRINPVVFLSLFLCTLSLHADDSITLDKIVVEGISPPGYGLISKQTAPHARSTVTREAIELENSQNNVYQAIDLVPGVNTYSYDATGLFGGGFRMRGFNSDQIGVTIDGVPMNDAGNFAVYPSELVDLENVEEISVIQGTSDIDTPMVGSTGGSLGMVTTAPSDEFRFRAQQSYGAYDAYKTYLRADTGYLGDKLFKAFISVSKAEAEKWKGYGRADREHLDFRGVFNITKQSSVTAGFLYNELFNNHLRSLTLDQIDDEGRDADFGHKAPEHLVGVNGTAQIETRPADSFYDLRLNPYKNYLATLQGRFQLLDNLRLEIDPYYSYGYGTGGNQLRTLSEGNSIQSYGGGIQDINGDGDTLDTIMIYSSGLTETERPGVTARLKADIANHKLLAGYWFEFSHHRRSQPAVTFNDNGHSSDAWLEHPSKFIRNQDGSAYSGRDFLTRSYSQSFFAQDDIRFFDDKLLLSLGLRYTKIKRDFDNFASNNYPVDYNVKKTYDRFLPNIGIDFQFTKSQQVFLSRAENFKAPPDYVYYGLIKGGSYNDQGEFTGYTKSPVIVDEETSTNWDLGYRFTGENFSFSGTLFYIDYRDRIASSYDIDNDINTVNNVGDSTTKGAELEAAWNFYSSWSLYGSFTYTDSEMEDDLQTGPDTYEQTSGQAFPDAPELMAGAALQYRQGPIAASLSAKYTGKRYSTLVNDESIDGYTLVNFDASYQLPNMGWVKRPIVKFNVYNLFDEDYLNLNAGSGSGYTTRANGLGGRSPSYYVGAPRSFSVMVSTDF